MSTTNSEAITSLNRQRLYIPLAPRYDIKEQSILEIEKNITEYIDHLIPHILNHCSNRLINAVIAAGMHRKDRKQNLKTSEERKGCVVDYVSKYLDLIKQEAKIFHKYEEDKTNKIHTRKRRKILIYLNKIFEVCYVVIDI